MSSGRIAFLRGINVGGKRRVPMADLRSALDEAGFGPTRTLVQSGNVVFRSRAKPATLERNLGKLLTDTFGFEVAVVVRTRDELAAVIKADPFAKVVDDPARYQVSFLSGKPDPIRVRELKDAAVVPERVSIRGREVYAWHPGGVGRSGLAKLITDKRLGTEVTARNWRTVTQLLKLADDG